MEDLVSLCRLSMNDPPTALVGLPDEARVIPCRPSMNDPPTGWWDYRMEDLDSLCRLGMNDPPTALVGLLDGRSRLSL